MIIKIWIIPTWNGSRLLLWFCIWNGIVVAHWTQIFIVPIRNSASICKASIPSNRMKWVCFVFDFFFAHPHTREKSVEPFNWMGLWKLNGDDIYVADIVRIWISVQLELIKSGITHQCSFGGWPRKTYDDTWKPFKIFGVTHKKNSFLNANSE